MSNSLTMQVLEDILHFCCLRKLFQAEVLLYGYKIIGKLKNIIAMEVEVRHYNY